MKLTRGNSMGAASGNLAASASSPGKKSAEALQDEAMRVDPFEIAIDHGGIAIDHLGIAVKSIGEARTFYELLGLRVEAEEVVEQEQVRVAMLTLGESRIELLEPTAEDSPVGKFLARRGEGLHHVALRVPDIQATFERLRARGVRLVKEEIGSGAGGHAYFFVHPASAGGVLLEVCGSPQHDEMRITEPDMQKEAKLQGTDS